MATETGPGDATDLSQPITGGTELSEGDFREVLQPVSYPQILFPLLTD